MRAKAPKSFWGKLARSAGFAALGCAAIAIPMHLFLRRELVGALDVIRAQGWPIRLMQVLFAKYILRWIEVEGVEHLPNGSFVLAANHAYKTGVDGFIHERMGGAPDHPMTIQFPEGEYLKGLVVMRK